MEQCVCEVVHLANSADILFTHRPMSWIEYSSIVSSFLFILVSTAATAVQCLLALSHRFSFSLFFLLSFLFTANAISCVSKTLGLICQKLQFGL